MREAMVKEEASEVAQKDGPGPHADRAKRDGKHQEEDD